MDLPRIKTLDLRDPEVAHEIDNYGVFWDWPEFPVDVLTFINTGVRPSASRKVIVKFKVNAQAFKRALAKMEWSWDTFCEVYNVNVKSHIARFQKARDQKRYPAPLLDEWVSHRGW